jgi:hypothetical protein
VRPRVGEWAESSDFFTADQTSPGACCLEELAIIKRPIAAADAPAPVSITKGLYLQDEKRHVSG